MYATVKKEFLNPNLIQDHYKGCGQRLDLLVKTKDEIINVELNTNYSEEVM